MASKKKQKGMVFHQEGTMAPAAESAPEHPPAYFVSQAKAKERKGDMEQVSNSVNNEADITAKPHTDPSKVGPPAVKQPTNTTCHSNNLPPDSIYKGVKVTLDNNNMWNEFFRCQTEMILTKQGSRMFPYCRFRISGLNPSRKYALIMDIQPLDNSRYKWTGKSWQVAGKAECHVKSQPFSHPESPSSGQHWMQNPVSFYKLKLTDNISEQDGNIILHPMHRYLPRLHVVQTDKTAKDITLNGSNVVTFTFPQTEFMAVTAYQNSQFAQLKVNYNPFAKGLKEDWSSAWRLKLKLNSGKESIKDGGTTATEQHPVKKSLKSLLANHKPKTSKTADVKSSSLGDLDKKISTSKDQSTSKVPNKSLCNSHPAQKLFSELIREAHVSLQRCNVEQLGNGTKHGSEQTNTRTVALKSHGTDSMSVKSQNETSSARKGEAIVTDGKRKEDKHLQYDTTMDSSEGSNVAPSALNQHSPVHPDPRCKPEPHSETNLKQHKRPAPLPLPALALFLKQHSTKSKKLKSKLDSPVLSLPSGSLSGPQSSSALSACLSVDHSSSATDLFSSVNGYVPESSSQATGCPGLDVIPDEMAFNCPRHVVEKAPCPSSLPCVDLNGLRTENSVLAERSLMLLSSDNPLAPPLMSTSSTFPPPLDTVLPALKLPQTGAMPESDTLPTDSPDMKSESLLSYSECSSISFEPLSAPSSPEPLPPLPATLTLELDHSASGSTVKGPESLQHSRNSAASVFKWHTVLPPPEPYNDASFPTFQPTPQALPIVPPFLNSQVPSHPELQPLHTSTAPTAPAFQENEHSLPFPAELSPLTLQLPLSPTFSSLDGDGLSPTPSLADLVHFFSTDDDLGMGVEFSNTEAVVTSCSPPSAIEATSQEFSQQVQLIPVKKSTRCKRTSRQHKLGKNIMDQQNEDSSNTRMQPNFEEVEEQLFISFTSKEALRLHIADFEPPVTQTTPEAHLQPATDAANDPAESLEERISALEMNLLRGLRQMKHRQVIHPVLQEVGLKMNLLDPTLAIDLQYLGVRLPIPTPGVSLELLTQELPPTQAFVSRTGKTTDVTQIKGWREKFTPSEAPPTPSAKPEAGPSSDLPKKNLSAFCSDMLDEYLEHEGKLIDERAASFSQTQVEPVVYELPTRSMSYVRTLDSVLKKQPSSSPTSDLISGFIPPSKRPKLSLKERNTRRKGDTQLKVPKRNKLGPKPESEPAQEQTVPTVSTPGLSPPSKNTAPHKSKKKYLEVQFTHTEPSTLSSKKAALKERRKLKPKPLSHTLSPLRSTVSLLPVSEDMAPLESDSELGPTDQVIETGRNHRRPVMTRALLRQKDLEDGMVWEGRLRTSITKERAAIALTSLFTLMGFVSENPTAPIQLVRRQAPSCLNEFCRLGCICSSLSHCSRISHCGRQQCMFGCSCLKQKVVLLKNLDGSDSSPSQNQNDKNKKRKRRMKMAYILKEADSVSQPAERVRTLWNMDSGISDPEPVHIPEPSSQPDFTESRQNDSSCARSRGFTGQKTTQKLKEATKLGKSKVVRLKSLIKRDLTLKEPKTKSCVQLPVHEAVLSTLSKRSLSPPSELLPKPSKRLIILAECKWESDSDRNYVLKKLCESMAQDRLGDPFWIKKYLISPLSQTVEDNGTNRCIQYKIHISSPKVEREKLTEPHKSQLQLIQKGSTKPQQRREGDTKPQQRRERDTKPNQEQKELGPLVRWQQEVEKEEELLEYWQREVEDDDTVEHDGYSLPQADNKKMAITKKKNSMGLPFLTGISPAGFLLATRKKAGGTDHLVQVNGKLYPLAKIQLGKMGALHPANRLAAYLTGRVGTNKDKQVSSPIPPQTLGSTSQISLISSVRSSTTSSTGNDSTSNRAAPRSQTSVLTTALSSAGLQGHQSTAHEAPEGADTRLNLVNIGPRPEVVASQVKLVPAANNSTPNDSQRMSVVRTVNASEGSTSSKRSQMLMVEVLGSVGNIPVTNSTAPPSMSQRMVLKPVHTVSGVHYYRKPDGRLVQLVPVSQLRPGKPNLPVQKVLPPSPLQTPTLPLPAVTTSSTSTDPSISSNTSFVSGLRFSPVSTSSVLTQAASSSLPQKGMSTFEFHSIVSNKEPVSITSPKVPLHAPSKDVPVQDAFLVPQPHPSPDLTSSFKPSHAVWSEIGVKTVTAAPLGSTRVWAPKEPTVTESCITETPTERSLTTMIPDITSSLPPASGKTSPEPEVACGLVDLDIICVNDESMEMVNTGGSSSSETENSSDFESDSDREKDLINTKPFKRLLHNVLERKRRGQIMQLFESLKKEVGLNHEKTSKISTLKKAVQVIEELRKTHRYLERKKRRLMKKRDEYLSNITLTTDKQKMKEQKICRGQRLQESVTKDRRRKHTADMDLMEVVDLLEETEEPTDNSSDEEHKEDEVQCVAMETEEENSQLNMAQRRLAKMRRSSETSSSLKKTSKASRALSLPQTLLIEKACEQIRTLQNETQTLDPNPRRDYPNPEFTQDSVECDLMVQGKLWQLSSNRKEMEEDEREGPPNQVPVSVGGGDSKHSPIGNATVDNVIVSLDQHQTPQAPPTAVSIITPVQQPQVLLQLANQVLAAPAPVLRDKPRTMPNILSRSRNPAPPLPVVTSTVEGKPSSFQALVPTEVLSLVGTALPGQPVLNLSPLMAGPTVLQTAPAPGLVSLNFPNLTNRQIHLASLPCPPNATNFNLLKLVQPTPKQQMQQVPVGRNPPPPPPSMASSQSNQIKDHSQHQTQTDPRPETSSPPHSLQSSPRHPGPSKGDRLIEAGAASLDQRKETASLTSLLNEINFLNQTVSVATQARVSSPGRRLSELDKAEQAHPHGPWVLQLDSDSGETVTVKTQDAGFTEDQRATTNRNSKSDVLAPPPLLQMNVGGATISDLANSNGQPGGEAVGGRTSEVGVAWRPMPRLVPLGLRGNQAS